MAKHSSIKVFSLTVFFILFAFIQVGVADDIGTVGKWLIEKDTSPIDDSPIAILALPAGENSSNNRIMLFIRYKNAKTEVFINWHDYIGYEGLFNVITRFDKEKAETRNWSISSNKIATFYKGNDINLIKKMMKADKLFARVIHYDNQTTDAFFDLRHLSEAIDKVNDTCHWK